MEKTNFDQTVHSLYDGLDHVISTKSVVGEPQQIGDTIIVPLMDVSFGMGAGAFNKEKSDTGAGGIGGKMSPTAVLVIHNGVTRLVSVKNQDAILKIIDMAPDVVEKVMSMIKSRRVDPEEKEAVDEAVDKEKNADSKREEM